jgi:hypothetical protein
VERGEHACIVAPALLGAHPVHPRPRRGKLRSTPTTGIAR